MLQNITAKTWAALQVLETFPYTTRFYRPGCTIDTPPHPTDVFFCVGEKFCHKRGGTLCGLRLSSVAHVFSVHVL